MNPVPLVEVTRGDLLYQAGDPHFLTFARSTIKPFQATVDELHGTAYGGSAGGCPACQKIIAALFLHKSDLPDSLK